jgi:hypothetical protein
MNSFFANFRDFGGFPLKHDLYGIDLRIVFFVLAFIASAFFWESIRRRREKISRWLLTGGLVFATAAYAASSTLANLSAASSVAGTDLFYDVQTAGTGGVKATAAQIATYEATANGYGFPASYYVSSNWYGGLFYNTPLAGSQAVTANTVYCSFGMVTTSVTIKALGGWISTAVAASNGQFAVYSLASGTLTLVDSTASVATTSSAATVSQTVANTTDVLSPNVLYAFCANDDHAVTWNAVNAGMAGMTVGSSTLSQVVKPSNASGIVGVQWSASLGTWASTEALSSTTNTTNASGVITPYVVFEVN